MPRNIEDLAKALGAEVVAELPDTGGGVLGAARLATILQSRLAPGRGQRPGRPSVASWDRRPKIPMSAETERRLAEMARRASSDARKVSPMQLAGQLLEDAVSRLTEVGPERELAEKAARSA